MEQKAAIVILAALAQATRLEAFRLLVKHEPQGLAAGDLARLLAVPPNTLSSHLSIMARANLVLAERHSRSIVYRANLPAFHPVVLFLLQDCCLGHPEECARLIESLATPRPPSRKKRLHVRQPV
jgi:ArsR family transcriptional regulator, arsenate/arsenite/antimonite-responsive transcriptional repressor